MTARSMTFGVQTAPSTDVRKPDKALYDEVIEDVKLAETLGYESVWMLEHHFSDYYPTPSPLLFMAHVAALCPDIGLGTSVLVLPWYHPVRIAEEISMLNSLTRGVLHLGLGRGTAKSEYDAYGVSMPEARGRFAESLDIIRKGLSGREFTHDGAYYRVPRPVRLRPEPVDKPVRFYGAIGSPQSAGVMAGLALPPLCLSTFPARLLEKILATWDERAPGACRPQQGDFDQDADRRHGRRGGEARAALFPALFRDPGGPLRGGREPLGEYRGIPAILPHVRQSAQDGGPGRTRPLLRDEPCRLAGDRSGAAQGLCRARVRLCASSPPPRPACPRTCSARSWPALPARSPPQFSPAFRAEAAE